MNITRAYFRLSDLAAAQHETALVQATSKLVVLGKVEASDVMLVRSAVLPLGTLLITGIYDKGAFQCAVVTSVDDKDLPNTVTIQELAGSLPDALDIGGHC